MGLSKQSQTQLIGLLDKTNLEEVISFSTQITNKLQSLELLEKIVLSEIERHIDLYQEVSKTIFRNSWLMGDEYSNSIPTPPQQYIIDILENLFATYIPVKANRKTNIIEGCKASVKKLTSQITYNERRLDYGKKEISAIVILAPAIQVSQYETTCIDSFLYALGNNNGYSKEKIVFKIYFIASRLDDFARQRINKAVSERFVYPNMNPDSDGIRAYLMDWASLIEHNRDKLSCASEALKMKRIDVETTFLQEYPDLFERKNTAQLRIVK